MMDDVREQALAEAKRTYAGFITFLKWVSFIFIALILVMGMNNFLDDPTASQSDPSWKEDYMSNMEIDE
jgi:hypothetical protein|tara:strand:- start:47 stop:253 length:207 start_codon:yes stop_codon:yes gene_type:complete